MKSKIIIGVALLILTGTAFGQATTVGEIADALIPQFKQGVAPMLSALSYIFGLFLGVRSIFKLKEYNETKGQQVKLHVPIVLLIAAAMFFSLPKLINVGITTFGFDKGGQSTFKF